MKRTLLALLVSALVGPAGAATLYETTGSFFWDGSDGGAPFDFSDETDDGIDLFVTVDGLSGPSQSIAADLFLSGTDGDVLSTDAVLGARTGLPAPPGADGRFTLTFAGPGARGQFVVDVAYAFDGGPGAFWGTAVASVASVPLPTALPLLAIGLSLLGLGSALRGRRPAG